MSHKTAARIDMKEVERLLAERRWTMRELAEHLDVTRQAIHKCIVRLESERPIENDGKGRYWIDRTTYVSEIALRLDEALVLYLAARRQQRQTWLKRAAVAEALSKLAHALRKPMGARMLEAANQVRNQPTSASAQDAVMVEVVKGWANGQVLALRYRGLKGNRPYDDRFRTYLIEPSPWGDGIYLIGWSETLGKEVSYKVDRIERASCSGETFEVPSSFSESALFDRAWGIWAGEGEPEQVRLRFAPGPTARRVRESVWHHSAQRRDLPNGGCELTLTVGEVTELIPWIRSWGPNVEVLEPRELREQLVGEARRLLRVYGASAEEPSELADTFDDFFGE